MMNYEKDIKIDEEALDIMWLNQASLFMRYAKNAAEARRDLDEAKQDLDIKKAEVDKAIREDPSKFGLEKITETAIQSAILTEGGYQKAFKTYLDAKYESDMASSAVVAMNQRKEALEALVKLHGQSYFAGPSIPMDIKKRREEKEKDTDKGISGVLKGKNSITRGDK